MKKLFPALCALILATFVSGCSDTPSEVVQKDFFTRQHLTAEQLKEQMRSGTPKEQKLAADWSDREFRQTAESRNKYLRGAVLRIDSEQITGDTATVKATIVYAGKQTEETVYTLDRSGRTWKIRPPKQEDEQDETEDEPVEEEE